MSHLLKEKRTQKELRVFLKDKTDDYVLEQYAQARNAFEEDVKKVDTANTLKMSAQC